MSKESSTNVAPLVKMLLRQNLVRFFLLPLTKREITYDTRVMKDILLDAMYPTLWIELQPNVHFSSERKLPNGKRYLEEDIEVFFLQDVLEFRSGRYSHFSDAAKERIFNSSGLLYNISSTEGMAFSDSKLLALNRHQALREALNMQLGTDLGENDELLPAPQMSWFMDSSTFPKYPK